MLGAILAGGLSKRMGSPKSELRLHGQPVLKVLSERIRPFCSTTVVVCRDDTQASTLTLPHGLSSICDSKFGNGPLGGLHAALMNALAEPVLLLACDVPFVESALLQKLVARFRRDQPAAVLPRTRSEDGLHPQPLCSIWSQSARPHVERALSERRLSLFRLAGEIGAAYVDLNPDEARQLRNVNSPEDLTDGLSI